MESAREVVRNYDVHIDSKKRVTLRGATYHYYNVKEYENGCIMLEPRELVAPVTVSKRSLESMDKAMVNFKKGEVSEPVAIGEMTEDEVCEEVLKGLKSAERKTYTVDEVDEILRRKDAEDIIKD